jgi:hypothetical protein
MGRSAMSPVEGLVGLKSRAPSRLRLLIRQADGEGVGIEGRHEEAAHRRGRLVQAGSPNSAETQAVTGPAESLT